jgi:hypothetical protein
VPGGHAGWLGPHPAGAAAPFDHRPTEPNDPAERRGSGYLLSDPSRGARASYWAGAYTSLPGLKSYCIDRFYDYPRHEYGYVTTEVSGWAGRPGSNAGATGHTAQRLIWIVNTYGQSPSRDVDAAVGVSIHRLVGGASFARVYNGYYRPQLSAINAGLPALIETMLADSDRFAGPYTTRVTFGVAPPVGGVGQFAVSIRSARDYPVRKATFTVTAFGGGRLVSPATGSTGVTGVTRLSYVPTRAGTVGAVVRGATTGTTVRLAQSPTHAGATTATGSQRVLTISANPVRAVPAGAGRVLVAGPVITTQVVNGVAGRPVGTPVNDDVSISGLVAGARYDITAVLRDDGGRQCGSVNGSVTADRLGLATWRSPNIEACGSGRDTFTETLSRAGVVLVTTRPNQPTETFPVVPLVATQVRDGNGSRSVGSSVADVISGRGFTPGIDYRVLIRLLDAPGRECGTATVTTRADTRGDIELTSPGLPVCGSGSNTFVEEVRSPAGMLLAQTPPGVPSETFPVQSPPAVVPVTPAVVGHQPVATPPRPTATGTPSRVRPVVVPVKRAIVIAQTRPPAELAVTGSVSYRTAGLGFGALGVGIALCLMAGRPIRGNHGRRRAH